MNPSLSKSLVTVRAVAVPTSSYVAGTVFSMDTQNYVGISVVYSKGDETSLQVKVEFSFDGGTTYTQTAAESTSGGTITGSLAERSYAATGNYLIVINPIKADTCKISVKATGGTPTGTVGVKAITSWV